MRITPTRHRLLVGCLLIVGAAAVGAQLGWLHWLGDSLALIADYYVLVALVLLLGFVWRRSWRLAAVAGAIILLAGYQLTSAPRVQHVALPKAERSLRLLVFNIYYLNNDLDAVVDVVKQYDPDIVFLMEYSDAVQRRIEPAFADYPYQLIRPSRFTMGLALFSRFPIEAAEVHRNEETRIPVYEVRLRAGNRQFTFVGGHPWPPQLRWGALHRSQMEAITRVVADAAPPLLVAGDFNAAPWSYTMRRLVEQGQILPIRRGFDVSKTWRPILGFGLPIDHILVSAEWQVLAHEYGPAGGSDHVPMIVDLHLP